MEYSHCGTMYILIIWNMEIVKQELHITFQTMYVLIIWSMEIVKQELHITFQKNLS